MAIYLTLLLLQPQQKPDPISTRAVDFVSITDQLPLYGVVLERGNRRSPTLIAVQRDWLKKERPNQYKQYRDQEIERTQRARKVVLDRIETWIEQRPNEEHLLDYLEEQQTKLKAARVPEEPKTQFMLVELKPKDVRRVKKSVGKLRRPLWVAYREKLNNIEIRSSESLEQELTDKGIAIPLRPIDLSSRIPSRGDDEQQWAGRQAIIEQLYRKGPVKLSGTPEMVIREPANGQPANVEALLGKLMRGRMDSLLNQLSQPIVPQVNPPLQSKKAKKKEWFEQATKEAERFTARAAYVQLVIPDPNLNEAVVEAYLIGQMPKGSWKIVWKTRHSVRPGEDPDLVEQIRENPQVKQAIGALGQLGQGGIMDKALSFGAATMKAQQKVMEDYVKWRDPFFDSLEGPMLVLPKQ